MQYTQAQILQHKLSFMTIADFVKKYHPTIQTATVSYWIDNDFIDWFRPGLERFVVLTYKTLSKKPNRYKTRKSKNVENGQN